MTPCRPRRSVAWQTAALLAAALLPACGGTPERPRSLLLVSLDTVRADRLGCYGYERPTSPFLDRLATSGTLFENASTQSPWTLPSHASLLTGLFPHRHGVAAESQKLSASVPTLASILADAGFTTGAVVTSHWLGRRHGLTRGFGGLEQLTGSGNRGAEVTDLALGWLEQVRPRPFFLFVHYYDAHSSYLPEPRFRRGLVADYAGPADGSTRQLLDVLAGSLRFDARDARHVSDLYDAEIRQLDAQLRRLFGGVARLGLQQETLVVITSDHGEEFLEHGGVLHGRTFFQEVIHVPLLVLGPGVPRGRRVAAPAMLVDVVPTVLARLGLAPSEPVDGIDLLGPARDLGERIVFAAADWRNGPPDRRRMLRQGDWKLVYDRIDKSVEIYDLATDPAERHDRAAEHPARVERLLAELPGLVRRQRSAESIEPRTQEEVRQLKALGYLED